jgi:hypothetical protein
MLQVAADYAAKRRLLEIVFLNCRLEVATLVPTLKKASRRSLRRASFKKQSG